MGIPGRRPAPIEDRLVAGSKENDRGCLIWQFRKSKGYGTITCPDKDRMNRQKLVHEVAWQQVHGPVPPGFYLHHRCDNRACIRVPHLYISRQSKERKADKKTLD